MSVYTVYEPPPRATDARTDPARFAFIRDGFYCWAFLLTPFWMARHRLWLVLVLFLIFSAVIGAVLKIAGAPASAFVVIGFLISLLAGLEAGTLRRFTLARCRWRAVGIVIGDDLEDAERRFFDAWVRQAPPPKVAPAKQPEMLSYAPPPRSPEAPGVIGLFPEPGA
jgi:Protein of unknown function (DUF2628)